VWRDKKKIKLGTGSEVRNRHPNVTDSNLREKARKAIKKVYSKTSRDISRGKWSESQNVMVDDEIDFSQTEEKEIGLLCSIDDQRWD
jgi:hypothetical protein